MYHARRLATAAASAASRNVVFVEGCRIPFVTAQTTYKDLLAVELGSIAMKGLLNKTAIDPKDIDYILYGTVIQEPRTSNIARESALNAGIPKSVPAHTITQACISANQAICTAVEKILSGQAEVVLAGGVETFSDVPIRLSRPLRQRLLSSQKDFKKGAIAGVMSMTKGLKMTDVGLETPAIANYTTGEVMGHNSDRLACRFGVSRESQDEFAFRSHVNAFKAHADGLYKDEIIPVRGVTTENGIKGDSTVAKLSTLKPAFIKPHGTHTAANSSFLSDGASASLIMTEERALAMGLRPKAFIRGWSFVAVDPFEDLLLGPTYATHQVLKKMGMSMKEIGVFEIHEAFAGQVLANLTAMKSEKFAREALNSTTIVGEVPMDKMNTLGGSLSIGHPFGATGTRLVTTASNRMMREQQRFALVAACADSGLGHACVLERYDGK